MRCRSYSVYQRILGISRLGLHPFGVLTSWATPISLFWKKTCSARRSVDFICCSVNNTLLCFQSTIRSPFVIDPDHLVTKLKLRSGARRRQRLMNCELPLSINGITKVQSGSPGYVVCSVATIKLNNLLIGQFKGYKFN